jgi:signal transduction histidine kinase/DNA-binding response OmpR family regulator
MHKSLRLKITAWFAFVTLTFLAAGLIDFWQLAGMIEEGAMERIEAKIDHIDDVLVAAEKVYGDLLGAAVELLGIYAAGEGPASVRPPASGSGPPELVFGSRVINGSDALIGRLHEVVGASASFFVREGGVFVRIATNVRTDGGELALGTELDPAHPAAAALLRGEPYRGIINVFGHPFLASYEPLRDPAGRVIGAMSAGYAIGTLSTLRDTIEDHGLLEHGFFALVDERGEIVFRTRGVKDPEAADALAEEVAGGGEAKAGWVVRTGRFDPWGYAVVAAMRSSDILKKTHGMVWQVYGLASLIILAVLVVSFWLASKLSDALEAAETSREEALEARDAAEAANRTKSTFLANMSHELRTPMNAIIGYSEMLLEDADDPGTMKPDLEKIRSAGKHLLALINDILDVSKIEAGKMSLHCEEFDVARTVREVADTVAPLVEKNHNTLGIMCPENAGTMHSDLTKLRQTLFNLLSNAAKFTEHGTITIEVADVPPGRIRFRVSDTGIGMTPDQLGKIFTAFGQADASTTRKYGGTGLGLVISRKFCEMMGGGIEVTSEPGRGTTFTVDLPRNPQEPPAVLGREVPASGTGDSQAAVLVIDDDADAADLLRRTLEKQGYHVMVATSGARGLELARKMRPAAITLDVMMPGMDGWSVLSALKSDPATASIPVIMVTMLQDRSLGFALGASDYLTKPVEAAKLHAVLAAHHIQSEAPVLVVEDDPGNRSLLVRLLQKEGLPAAEAENGASALEAMRLKRPALILLDLMMPVMDGFRFLEEVAKAPEFAEIPVIAITAKDLTPSERDSLLGSVTGIIEKGAVDREQLMERITGIIRRRAGGRGA